MIGRKWADAHDAPCVLLMSVRDKKGERDPSCRRLVSPHEFCVLCALLAEKGDSTGRDKSGGVSSLWMETGGFFTCFHHLFARPKASTCHQSASQPASQHVAVDLDQGRHRRGHASQSTVLASTALLARARQLQSMAIPHPRPLPHQRPTWSIRLRKPAEYQRQSRLVYHGDPLAHLCAARGALQAVVDVGRQRNHGLLASAIGALLSFDQAVLCAALTESGAGGHVLDPLYPPSGLATAQVAQALTAAHFSAAVRGRLQLDQRLRHGKLAWRQDTLVGSPAACGYVGCTGGCWCQDGQRCFVGRRIGAGTEARVHRSSRCARRRSARSHLAVRLEEPAMVPGPRWLGDWIRRQCSPRRDPHGHS